MNFHLSCMKIIPKNHFQYSPSFNQIKYCNKGFYSTMVSKILRIIFSSLALMVADAFMTRTQIYPSSRSATLRELSTNSGDGKEPIRFLGKGDRAVVRPGVVMVAPNHEYNHFLMRSAVSTNSIMCNTLTEVFLAVGPSVLFSRPKFGFHVHLCFNSCPYILYCTYSSSLLGSIMLLYQ